ncbi:MAG: rhomboid family intramembrane serine protease [Deltaproteobacteria bacterium]|nr:rhomboid family intramembrane serine protease [Deltaproteobacteria bacterium]
MDSEEKYWDTGEGVWRSVTLRPDIRLTKQRARIWALVLDSRFIPCCIKPDGSDWQLLVPPEHLESARSELTLYEENNRFWPPPLPVARTLIKNTLPTVSVLILLATFHNLTLLGLSIPDHGIIDINEIGAAHALKILEGQWWRLVTSLTLHADFIHLLSNLLIGGVFITLICRELGSGLAWSLLLASGILGNLMNALLQSPNHRSVGASTAVFGAVGLMAAISAVRYRQHLKKRWFIPVAAGLAILAILGTEGEHTDLGAHLFGFVAGMILGLFAEHFTGKFGCPGRLLNALLASVAITVVMVAWWAALESCLR